MALISVFTQQMLYGQDSKENSDIIDLSDVVVQVKDQTPVFSVVSLDQDAIIRFRGTGNGDVFQGISGVQSNNIRNEAGALDIGIRGMEGEGRVPIVIDGSLQSTHTFRGYQGNSDRTYIDMDLISSAIIDKGSNGSKFGTGALGGVVQMKTLGVADIVEPGKQYGFLVKGSLFNNNRQPIVGSDEQSQNDYILTNKLKGKDFRNGAFTLGAAYQNDLFDFVAAYSHRKVGNYFAGKHGKDRTGADKWDISPGQEVPNTSFASNSGIVKLGLNINDEQRLEVNLRRHVQKAGEIMAFYFSKTIKPEGDNVPQWKPGSATVNTGNIEYKYRSLSNQLIDVDVSLWATNAKMLQHNGISGAGSIGDQYLGSYTDNRKGINVSNTSILDSIPLKLSYGMTYDEQRMKPINRDKYGSASRNAKRIEKSVFLNTNYAAKWFDIYVNGRLHKSSITDYNGSTIFEPLGTETRGYNAQFDWSGQFDLHINENLDLYAKYSNSYRNPSLFEGSISGQTFTYDQDYPLKPENSRSYEIGMKGKYQDLLASQDKLTFGVNYFNNNIKNFITTAERVGGPNTPEWYPPITFTFVNYHQFLLKGYELNLSYDNPSFFVEANATFYKNPDICPGTANNCRSENMAWSLLPTRIPPKKTINITAGKYFMDKSLTVGGRWRYHSKKVSPQGWMLGTGISGRAVEYIPSDKMIDLFAKYNMSKDVEFTMSIDNLTNRYAIEPGAVIGTPVPGRTIRLGVEIKF